MKNWWIRFGCFLIGYNYDIIRKSSEASAKSVKKFTSAILIVALIWGFIGFTFCNRYLHLGLIGSIIGSMVMVFIIIQIERQIILNVGKNKAALVFRSGIAVIMALLGSLIIDQIIFKEDIKIAQMEKVNTRIDKSLESKVSIIKEEISRLDILILDKENERNLVLQEVTKKPMIKMPSSKIKKIPRKIKVPNVDKVTGKLSMIEKDTIYVEREYASVSVPNPKVELIPHIENEIKEYRRIRSQYISKKMKARDIVENEEKDKMGFLDELDTMVVLLQSNLISFFVWLLWLLFFMFIELFVVTGKMGSNNETDYDIAILHQRDVRIEAIKKLSHHFNDGTT